MSLPQEIRCSRPQLAVLNDWTSPLIFLVSGMGGGKTWAGAWFAVSRSAANPPGVWTLAIEPTFPMLAANMIPELVKVFDAMGATYTHNKNERVIAWGPEQRVILMRSAEIPERLAGPTVGSVWFDEPAQMDAEAYRRGITRMRDERAVVRQALFTGTHEGDTWFSRMCVRHTLVQGTSFDNEHNGPDYIQNLRNAYQGDDAGWQTYVLGRNVSRQGNIYFSATPENFRECHNPRDGEIVTGWDFNIRGKVTPVCKWHGGVLHVIGEVVDEKRSHTFDFAPRVREYLLTKHLATDAARGGEHKLVDVTGGQIDAHMDATGDTPRASAKQTDEHHVAEQGFWPRHPNANPFVADRITSVNLAFRERRLFIDPVAAPMTTRCIREHAYMKNGKPQKEWRDDEFPLDAGSDPLGYVVWGVMPSRRLGGLVGRPG